MSSAERLQASDGSGARLRLGFVGCGAIAQWHLSAIEAVAQRTAITAAVDVDRGRAVALAEKTGARAFGSLDEAIAADAFDAALIMLPHDLHEPVAIRALAAGKHVVLEKPMAPSLDACDRILAAARASGRAFLVAENAQHWPEAVAVKHLLAERAIGDVVTARAWQCVPPMEQFYGGERPWRLSQAATGGGLAIDAGSHWLRPLRMWLGELREVVAVTGRPWGAMEGESLCRALCRFDSGVVASFDVLLVPGAIAPSPFFQITGTAGEIVVERTGRVVVYDGSDANGRVAAQGGYLLSYREQVLDLERVLLDGAAPAATAEFSLGELRGALAMVRSADSGRWEKVW